MRGEGRGLNREGGSLLTFFPGKGGGCLMRGTGLMAGQSGGVQGGFWVT